MVHRPETRSQASRCADTYMRKKRAGSVYLYLGASELNFGDCLPDKLRESQCGDHSGDDGSDRRGRLTNIFLTVTALCCSNRRNGFISSRTFTRVSRYTWPCSWCTPGSSPGRVLGVSPPLPTQLGAEGFVLLPHSYLTTSFVPFI
jgi:hypothetical protein